METGSITPLYDNAVENFVANESETEGLSERQKVAYLELKKHEDGLTAKELSMKLYRDGKVMSNERNSVHPRLNELIHIGLVVKKKKKTCQFSNKKVTIYKVK